MNRLAVVLPAVAVSLCAAMVAAKLPPPSDEAKAKASEAAAKTAHADKMGAYKLCKSMDKVAADYQAAAKKAGKPAPPVTATPPCTDPGPFAAAVAAAAPAKPPLEAAGAHSPPKTATAPPSSNTPAAAQTPAKK